jgi:hypothetical protein
VGDCNVTAQYKANPPLGTWVRRQRKYFKSNLLSKSRIAKLNEIGFTWEFIKEDDWIKRYKELVEYKHEVGDCNVPAQYQANPPLAYWVQRQRKYFKSNSLPEYRAAKLNEIGFAWESKRKNRGS